MGIFGRNIDKAYGPAAKPLNVVSPWQPQDVLHQITVDELWPEHETPQTITRESALRIPAVKRAHDIHCGVLSRMPWRQYAGETEVATQPGWLVTSGSGIGPRTLRWGVASDLFMNGWAAIGFQMTAPGQPADALHIPFGMWGVNDKGVAEVNDERVPTEYTDLIVPIWLGYGSAGMLTDGRISMQAARSIEASYRDRVENPTAHTHLTVDEDHWEAWGREGREQFRELYVKGRKTANGSVSLKPSFVTVETPGTLPIDLFENARNGVRLDIANHAGIPASLLEGSKQGGGTDIKYSGVNNGATRNELWDYGLAKYADAIESRLSLDDVCPSGESIRVDATSYLAVPQQTTPLTSED